MASGPRLALTDGARIEGYASLFNRRDRGGDTVLPGAYAGALKRLAAGGGRVRMLWQHDPTQPIGVWDEVVEDARGLRVKGRLLPDVTRAREAAALIAAGALDGLSIGYRTLRAAPDPTGGRRLLELDLWEVSLVTFPMLTVARVAAKGAPGSDGGEAARDLAALAGVFSAAGAELARLRARRAGP
ncbi:MAG: HK97 family phage prohead protease [Rhodobacteraceae bacterium]|nr:HK97 family phage prohead protease [Paracoccaceae bacterium]